MSTNTYYTYDKSHRLTSQYILAGEAHYYAYNERNMVTSIQDVGGSADALRTFVYNGRGERVVAFDSTANAGQPAYWSYDGRKFLQDKQRTSFGGFNTTNYRHNSSGQDCPLGAMVEVSLSSDGLAAYPALDGAGNVTNIQSSGPNDSFVANSFTEQVVATNTFGTRPRSLSPSGEIRAQTTQEVYLLPMGGIRIPSKNIAVGAPGASAVLVGLQQRGICQGILLPWPWPWPWPPSKPPKPPADKPCKEPGRDPPGKKWVNISPPPSCSWLAVPDDSKKDTSDCNDPTIQGAIAQSKIWSEPLGPYVVRKTNPSVDPLPFENGLVASDPANALGLSPAEHALNQHSGQGGSPFISASERFPQGAATIEGSRLYIDIDKATQSGATFMSNSEVMDDMNRLISSDPSRWGSRAQTWLGNQGPGGSEREAFFEGPIPPVALDSPLSLGLKYAGRGLTRCAQLKTVYDLTVATRDSLEAGSPDPIARESIRQTGAWGGSWLGGALGGFVWGAAGGLETGPGALVFGIVGGVLGGISGHAGANALLAQLDDKPDVDPQSMLFPGEFYDPLSGH